MQHCAGLSDGFYCLRPVLALASHLPTPTKSVTQMSIWKDNTASLQPRTPAPAPREPARVDPIAKPEYTPVPAAAPQPRADAGPRKESLIAADITIEGKIEGGGSVRIAGKFSGDVNVQGDLAVEAGAKLTGSVRADKVTIAGELEGNVEQATRVELTVERGHGYVPAGSVSGMPIGVIPVDAIFTPTWGNLLSNSQDSLDSYPYLVWAPGLAIVLTVLCVNFIGDGLRDALDPKQLSI